MSPANHLDSQAPQPGIHGAVYGDDVLERWMRLVSATKARPFTKLLCMAIASLLHENHGVPRPVTVAELVSATGMSKRSVQAHTAQAVRLGLVSAQVETTERGLIIGTTYNIKLGFAILASLLRDGGTLQ